MGFMSQNGNVMLVCVLDGKGSVEKERGPERILGLGLNWEDSVGWGYMTQLWQIGKHFYACGTSWQVYKREERDKWVHIDKGIVGKPVVGARMDDAFWIPNDINGPPMNRPFIWQAVVNSIMTMGAPSSPSGTVRSGGRSQFLRELGTSPGSS
jgi:hypothetical protein